MSVWGAITAGNGGQGPPGPVGAPGRDGPDGVRVYLVPLDGVVLYAYRTFDRPNQTPVLYDAWFELQSPIILPVRAGIRAQDVVGVQIEIPTSPAWDNQEPIFQRFSPAAPTLVDTILVQPDIGIAYWYNYYTQGYSVYDPTNSSLRLNIQIPVGFALTNAAMQNGLINYDSANGKPDQGDASTFVQGARMRILYRFIPETEVVGTPARGVRFPHVETSASVPATGTLQTSPYNVSRQYTLPVINDINVVMSEWRSPIETRILEAGAWTLTYSHTAAITGELIMYADILDTRADGTDTRLIVSGVGTATPIVTTTTPTTLTINVGVPQYDFGETLTRFCTVRLVTNAFGISNSSMTFYHGAQYPNVWTTTLRGFNDPALAGIDVVENTDEPAPVDELA